MNLNTYQAEAMSLRLPSANEFYAQLGLSGEVGELHSLLAKAVRDGAKDDIQLNIKKELGDILWFIAAIAADNGYSLEDVAVGNLTKLYKRKNDKTLQGSGDNR